MSNSWKQRCLAGISVCLCLVSVDASAGFVRGDALSEGDGLLVIDESTDLAWLSLNASAGQDLLQAGSQWGALGYRFASYAEVGQMLSHLRVEPSWVDVMSSLGGAPNGEPMSAVLGLPTLAMTGWIGDLDGVTWTMSDAQSLAVTLILAPREETYYSMVPHPTMPNVWVQEPVTSYWLTTGTLVYVTGDSDVAPAAVAAGGVFMVKAVPEPSSWALMGLGLVGLAGLSHRRSRTVPH